MNLKIDLFKLNYRYLISCISKKNFTPFNFNFTRDSIFSQKVLSQKKKDCHTKMFKRLYDHTPKLFKIRYKLIPRSQKKILTRHTGYKNYNFIGRVQELKGWLIASQAFNKTFHSYHMNYKMYIRVVTIRFNNFFKPIIYFNTWKLIH